MGTGPNGAGARGSHTDGRVTPGPGDMTVSPRVHLQGKVTASWRLHSRLRLSGRGARACGRRR